MDLRGRFPRRRGLHRRSLSERSSRPDYRRRFSAQRWRSGRRSPVIPVLPWTVESAPAQVFLSSAGSEKASASGLPMAMPSALAWETVSVSASVNVWASEWEWRFE